MKKIILAITITLVTGFLFVHRENNPEIKEYRPNAMGDTISNPIFTRFGYVTFEQLDTCTDTIMSNFYWPRQDMEVFCHIKDTLGIHIYYCWKRDCWIAYNDSEGYIAGNRPETIIEALTPKRLPIATKK